MDLYRIHFGKRLQEALTQAGRNQKWLSEKMDVKPATVSRWVNGHDFPKDRLKEICRHLGLRQDYFSPAKTPAPSFKPSPPEMKLLIESEGKHLPYGPMAQILQQFANSETDIRAAVLAILYEDASISAPYLDDSAESLPKAR